MQDQRTGLQKIILYRQWSALARIQRRSLVSHFCRVGVERKGLNSISKNFVTKLADFGLGGCSFLAHVSLSFALYFKLSLFVCG